ncbi:MAG TPA: site-2 protease family protein [Tepidisphaeraceae bacterium]|jgi:Zn-dependent protease|nr:site-2 protease family protein [Tepidisphaeraceae bacterium]
MGWEDRPYYRDQGGQPHNPLLFLLFGSFPLFTFSGIRVRVHMSLVLFIGLTLVIGGIGSRHYDWEQRLESMGILFAIVLLHEFGHCFAGRWVGGDADSIILTPLGGLAMANAPHRPWPTFVTVAGGPAVNVIICVIAAALSFGFYHVVPWNPVGYANQYGLPIGLLSYLFWIYSISLALLLFNLLPIFPLDGGQLLQSMLWPKLGYYRSMNIACIVGLVGGIILGVVGLFTSLLLVFIAITGIMYCIQMRRSLKEIGPEMEYAGNMMDYSASLRPDTPKKRRRASRWQVRRLRREAMRDAAEQQMIDNILAKVSAQGMHALTWSERRALKRATDRQRKRDLELSRRD